MTARVQEGMILSVRRARSDVRAMTVELVTINPVRQWRCEDNDSRDSRIVNGKEIREKGLEVAQSNRRDSRLNFHSVDREDGRTPADWGNIPG